MQKAGLASVIVVNYNGAGLLKECLDSLLGQTYKDIEIIVVDNGSCDGSCGLIEKSYSAQVKLIKSPVNTGFDGGNNLGIRQAAGEYIVLVNNDTKSDKDFVRELVNAAKTDDLVGMCAAKILTYGNPGIIEAAGHLIYKDGLNQTRGRFEVDRGQYETAEEIIYPSGCAALYKRKALDEAGLFDEDFFAYGDDTDIGLRARLMGWKALYAPRAVVYHKISQTGGQYSAFKLFFTERNRMYVVFKCYPLPLLLASFFYTAKRYGLQLLSIMENKGASKQFIKKSSLAVVLGALIRAYLSFIIHIPGLLVKRREVRGKKKISDREFLQLFKRFGIGAKKLVYNN